MYAKISITGVIEVVTGLHIGGGDAFSAIGAVDSSVIRDPRSGLPIIPGSSIKGKMRTLLARAKNDDGGYLLKSCDDDRDEILRLFGGSKQVADSDGKNRLPASRLKFSDCFMHKANRDELKELGVSETEVKFENTINRATSVANPRQIERVVRGVMFVLRIIYDMDDEARAEDDFALLREGLTLIENDYLGGHGSRGSGRVKFHNLKAKAVYGSVAPEILELCNKRLESI
ncbi:CRISPR type III-associated RAMP protein Csm3 [Synergistales bacterium]|nr:CRISPR type III-associated RAMP protein Csm3 [Synergistales bacterium]